jgi:hypothetical protein
MFEGGPVNRTTASRRGKQGAAIPTPAPASLSERVLPYLYLYLYLDLARPRSAPERQRAFEEHMLWTCTRSWPPPTFGEPPRMAQAPN